MNDTFHNFLKKAGDDVSLSSAERERMKRTIHEYMAMKPPRAQSAPEVVSPAWNIERFFALRPVAASLIVAFFVSTAGVSYAAEGALPGDALYPIKTHVNEAVAGALAVSAPAKAAWAMNVAGARIKEAATLAAQGRLNADTQEELRTSFETHAKTASRAIAEEASSSPETSAEVAVSFEAQLSEYERVLTQVGTAKDVSVGTLASSVRSERTHVASIRARTQADVAVSAAGATSRAVSRMRDAAKKQFEASSRLAHSDDDALTPSSARSIALQLADASTTISTGEDFLGVNAGPQALGAFQDALTAATKLGIFLQTTSAIHERTGLIISEPGETQSSSSAPRKSSGKRNDGREERGGEGTGTAPATPEEPQSSGISADPAVATGSGSVSASVQGNGETGDNTSDLRGEDGGADTKAEGRGTVQSILPISVPTVPHL